MEVSANTVATTTFRPLCGAKMACCSQVGSLVPRASHVGGTGDTLGGTQESPQSSALAPIGTGNRFWGPLTTIGAQSSDAYINISMWTCKTVVFLLVFQHTSPKRGTPQNTTTTTTTTTTHTHKHADGVQAKAVAGYSRVQPLATLPLASVCGAQTIFDSHRLSKQGGD